MNNKVALQPNEIRVIKFEKNMIHEMLSEVLNKEFNNLLLLPDKTVNAKRHDIGTIFDYEDCNVIIFTCGYGVSLSYDVVIDYIKKAVINSDIVIPSEADSETFRYSLRRANQRALFQRRKKQLYRPCSHYEGKYKIERLSLIKPRYLSKNELRFACLSMNGILRLLWNYFMDEGNHLMNLPNNGDEESTYIFRMFASNKLEELTLYVMNVNNASDSVFERTDSFCSENVQPIASFAKNCSYTSLKLSDI